MKNNYKIERPFCVSCTRTTQRQQCRRSTNQCQRWRQRWPRCCFWPVIDRLWAGTCASRRAARRLCTRCWVASGSRLTPRTRARSGADTRSTAPPSAFCSTASAAVDTCRPARARNKNHIRNLSPYTMLKKKKKLKTK